MPAADPLGINGAIGAVTLEAGNRGRKVVGIYDGFSHLMAGRIDRVKRLAHDDVSRIHFGPACASLAPARAHVKINRAAFYAARGLILPPSSVKML